MLVEPPPGNVIEERRHAPICCVDPAQVLCGEPGPDRALELIAEHELPDNLHELGLSRVRLAVDDPYPGKRMTSLPSSEAWRRSVQMNGEKNIQHRKMK